MHRKGLAMMRARLAACSRAVLQLARSMLTWQLMWHPSQAHAR